MRQNNVSGFTLIELIGVLAILATLMAMVAPKIISSLDRAAEDAEVQHLKTIGQGVELYLLENYTWPAVLSDLSPDYVPFADAQLNTNDRGFLRYFFPHPDLIALSNATGLVSSDVPKARFLLISDMTMNAAPTITNAAQFDAEWSIDDDSNPDRKRFRGQVSHVFHLLSLNADGNGGSYTIDGTATNSGGGLLPSTNNYHLEGTVVQLDEADPFATPEVQFNLTETAGYRFDPDCATGSQWGMIKFGCL